MILPAPYYNHAGITIYCGDCREILPLLEPVDFICTDPPYGLDFRGSEWDSKIPDWLPVAREKARVVAFTTAPTTVWDYPRTDWVLCWQRPAAQSRTATGTFNHWTPILVYGKGKWNPDCFRYNGNTAGQENKGINHPSPKPVALMKWLIAGADCKGVYDPFMGSGTTLLAAKELGIKATGIEISEEYCRIAVRRLSQEVFNFGEVNG